MDMIFPEKSWTTARSEDVFLSADALQSAHDWLQGLGSSAGLPWRVAVVRYGRLVADWVSGMEREEQPSQASIDKSFISCLLGIAVDEGKIAGLDAKVVDYYPEMMQLTEGFGPGPKCFVSEKDRDVTFRQLITQTSGYLKPGEATGQHFRYSTCGINLVLQSLATAYGLYDSAAEDRLPGGSRLLDDKIRDPIGAQWRSRRFNYNHPPTARISIFGNSFSILSTHLDMARAGLLWANGGRWRDRQLIPRAYLDEATKTAPAVMATQPEEKWVYGHAFWCNDQGRLWPDLPRDAFAASGAGSMIVFVCPSLGLVVAETPGPWPNTEKDMRTNTLIRRIIDGIRN